MYTSKILRLLSYDITDHKEGTKKKITNLSGTNWLKITKTKYLRQTGCA